MPVGVLEGLVFSLWEPILERLAFARKSSQESVGSSLYTGDMVALQSFDNLIPPARAYCAISSVYNGLNAFIQNYLEDGFQGWKISSNVSNCRKKHPSLALSMARIGLFSPILETLSYTSLT